LLLPHCSAAGNRILFAWTKYNARLFASESGRDSDGPLINRAIKYPSMRVVYEDKETGKSAWKILSRDEALEFAKAEDSDLILGK
jgi:hypothetical protein